MRIEPLAVAIVATLACCGPGALAQPAPTDTFTYVKRDTRDASRDATLARYMPRITAGSWRVIGPFDNVGRDKHDVAYPPEREIDFAASYEGKDGVRARWETIEDDGWHKIDLKRFDDDASNVDAIAYLYREVDADAEGTIEFEMGSDDGLKVWWNGRVMVDADVYRGMNVQDHLVRFDLRPGRNTLLVKVTQGVGGWEVFLRPRLDSRLLARLEYHLNRDFPASPEYAHYRPLSIIEPEGVVLEVGGLTTMPDGRPIVTTRRGEVWIVEGAYDDPPLDARFTRFAFGLHEALGATWRDGGLLVAQRSEVTRLEDSDGDDRADAFLSASAPWGVSGNYHEFAFGPEPDGAGNLWVTLNVGFCGSLGKSTVPWRGWALIVEPDGTLTPVCGGLRSPNGLGTNATGAMFATDNQGDWVGTNKLMHLAPGDWHGHPAGDAWYAAADMPAPRGEADFKPPAVWFPYDRMGRSASDILLDDRDGAFGPFAGQLYVGDQYAASIMRVCLEEVNGVWQGACIAFLSGLDCGVNRMCWGADGSMIVGMTNRGWWSHGTRPWGLQRVVYTGTVPFDVLAVSARPDGFEISFTKPIDRRSAEDLRSSAASCFTHERWEKYGSPEIDRTDLTITSATVAPDNRSVRLRLNRMRKGYVHELSFPGVRAADGTPLLHAEAWYTLNEIPGERR